MWFDFARDEGFPSMFPAKKYPVTVDVLEAGLIFSFVLLAVCFYIILPGRRGIKLVSLGTRITLSLFIGLVILLGNYGQDWEVGHIKSHTPYKVGTGQEIVADIGIKIGFRSVNVTLKSDAPPKDTSLENEVINYNERFDWNWDQGRFGFGPYAGLLQQEFREAQYRGLPLPILWIVDYFVFDGEGLRFGRFYRTAGWHCHILMWIAFACWVLANIFYASVIRYGNYFLAISGGVQLFACLIWGIVKNPMPLRIPFEDATITTKFGASFYLTLIGGILCLIISLVTFILDLLYPNETAEFFNIDPLSDYDKIQLSQEELQLLRRNQNIKGDMHLTEMGAGPSTEDSGHVIARRQKDVVLLKRKNTMKFSRKTLYNTNMEEVPIYGNIEPQREEEYSNIPMLPPKRGPKIPPRKR